MFRPKIVTTNTKVEKREILREAKALKAAKLDRAIENELLERLRQVSDTEIYNYPERQYTKALNKANATYDQEAEEEDEVEEEVEEEEEGEEEEFEEEDGDEDNYNIQYVEVCMHI